MPLTSRVRYYFKSIWNILDVVTIVMFVVGMTLRFQPYDGLMEAARVILGINLMTFFMRTLNIFAAFKQMGSKLVMIRYMVK